MKKHIVMILFFLLAVIAAVAVRCFSGQRQESAQGQDRPPVLPGMESSVTAAAGATYAGLTERELELDFLETELIVDEIYVSSSEAVAVGAKVLKITDNSLKEAVRELERKKMNASLSYRQGVIDYETGCLEAENTRNKSLIASEYAQIVYEDTIAGAEAEVSKAQQELEEAMELVEEYTAAIEEDYYYREYEVEEKKAAYEKNVALFFEKLNEYGYELDDDDDDDPNTFNIVKQGQGDGPGGSGQDKDGEVTVLNLLKSEYQENKEEYDQAVKEYEAATEKARAGIAEAQDSLELKLLALQEAQISLEKTRTEAQSEYDITVIKGEKAQDTYETELRSLQKNLDALADEKEEAQAHYDLFMETIGDGFIYMESSGTILMIRAMENSALSPDGVLMACSDASAIRVTASVNQSDIADIATGDMAAVVMEGYDTRTGVVSEIDPVSATAGRAAVGYNVTLELEGDVSALTAGLTANVYFGMTGVEYERLREQEQQKAEPAFRGDRPEADRTETDQTETDKMMERPE